MGRAYIVGGVLVCLVFVAGSSTSVYNDREFKELVKRVSKLEKETADVQKALARLEKSLSGIPKQAAATNRELVKRVADLQKTVSALAKATSQSGKNAAAISKQVKTVAARSDARTLLLAEWLDDYHPRQSRSQYHRDQIKSKR